MAVFRPDARSAGTTSRWRTGPPRTGQVLARHRKCRWQERRRGICRKSARFEPGAVQRCAERRRIEAEAEGAQTAILTTSQRPELLENLAPQLPAKLPKPQTAESRPALKKAHLIARSASRNLPESRQILCPNSAGRRVQSGGAGACQTRVVECAPQALVVIGVPEVVLFTTPAAASRPRANYLTRRLQLERGSRSQPRPAKGVGLSWS